MRPRKVLPLVLLAAAGCCQAPRQPRWEVSVSVNVENKPDPLTKLTGGVTLKRVILPAEKPKAG